MWAMKKKLITNLAASKETEDLMEQKEEEKNYTMVSN